MGIEASPGAARPSALDRAMTAGGLRRACLWPQLPLWRGAALCAVLSGTLSVGCDNGRLGRSGVSGSVTLDGSPVAEGTVSFVPVGGTQGPLTGGNIVAGRYAIARGDGPLAGTYRVDIVALRGKGKKRLDMMGKETEEEEKEDFLPKGKYSGPSSTLEVHIGAEANTHDFPLTSK